jgi:23S rRNA (guanosine2251-2'-O)-methyltransferase
MCQGGKNFGIFVLRILSNIKTAWLGRVFPNKMQTPSPNENKRAEKEIVFGIRPVMEAVEAGKEIDRVLIQKELKGELITELIQLCRRYRVPYMYVPIEKLNKITRKVHQGVVAYVSVVSFASLDHVISTAYAEGRDPFLLVLDGVTDIRNFGAIARTAECAGVDALVVPDRGSARLGSDAFKTSAGALSHLPICRQRNLAQSLRVMKENGLKVIACTEKTDRDLYQAELTGPVALLVGSEEDGISPQCLAMADARVRVPLFGKIASLNVSVAAAVVVYEAIRQRR